MTSLSSVIFTGEAGSIQQPRTLNVDPVDLERLRQREARFARSTQVAQQPQRQQQQQAQASGLGARALAEKVTICP